MGAILSPKSQNTVGKKYGDFTPDWLKAKAPHPITLLLDFRQVI